MRIATVALPLPSGETRLVERSAESSFAMVDAFGPQSRYAALVCRGRRGMVRARYR